MEGASIDKRASRGTPEQGREAGAALGAVRAGHGYPVWLWPNLLSLDAPVIAVAWQMLFAKAIGVAMPVSVHLLLGVAVWVFSVSDRLFDTARLDAARPATARHLFYRRHWKAFLAGVMAGAAFGAVGALRFLPEALVARGFFLTLLVWGYFGIVALMRRTGRVVIPKEILCGCLFAIGTGLSPAFYLSNQDVAGPAWIPGFLIEGLVGFAEAALPLPVFVFMALCCLMGAIIAKWEQPADRAHDGAALPHATRAFEVPFSWSLLLLAGISLLMMAREWGGGGAAIYICVAASALGLCLLERRARLFSQAALRTMADVALLTPLAALPMMG